MPKKKNDELENKDTEKEQEPGANEGENQDNSGADDTQSDTQGTQSETQDDTQPVNNPDENQDNSDSQNEPEAKEVTLKVEVNFTDKYDKSIKYKAGKEYTFNAERAKELLNDKRGLVSEVK